MNLLFYFENQINPMRGGTERVVDTIAHAMRNRGHSVYYMSRRKVDGEYDIPCYFLPDEEGNTQKNIDYVNELIKVLSLDIIVNEGGNTDDIYLISKEHILNCVIVTHLHFSPYLSLNYFYKDRYMPLWCKSGFVNALKWLKAPYNRRLSIRNTGQRYRYMITHSDKVITLAPTYISDLFEMAKMASTNNVEAIFNPTSFSEVDLSDVQKENIVLSVGRLVFSPKKIDLLLDVWEKAEQRMPEWKLQILGGGPDEDRLKKICRRKQLKYVEFLGFQPPAEYYKRAKAVCLTSLYEGTPMVITEAMQYGCVPMAYDTFSAVHDMIEDGKNGFVISPFDAEQYADRLVSLTSENTFNHLSKCATQSLGKFDYQDIMNKWEQMFINLSDATK